jgi:hypothetical protein
MSIKFSLPLGIFMMLFTTIAHASYLLIPMDLTQRQHLKAYGITYYVLENEIEAYWLLNYRGGSFAFPYAPSLEKECKIRDISFEVISDAAFRGILDEIGNPEVNQEAIKLEKAPKIAVYTPETGLRGERLQPWDDAVTLVLTYAEIPYDVLYDREILEDKLSQYDWLHLHHEDFTGQYGKFYGAYRNHAWYKDTKASMEKLAAELGFKKVSQLKSAVVERIREYVIGGGFMFAMCSATDTYDIALSAQGIDICQDMFDADPMDPNAQEKLHFHRTFAFGNFVLSKDPMEYEYSTIDNNQRKVLPENDYFTLFDFSAKWDPIPTMLTQNHTRTIKGFMGQTTAFNKHTVKSSAIILGDNKSQDEVRYLHGTVGKGQFTFYGGHDPEDYAHRVGDPETDLNLHPNSPGYRLILNNVLFPAAKKKQQKT